MGINKEVEANLDDLELSLGATDGEVTALRGEVGVLQVQVAALMTALMAHIKEDDELAQTMLDTVHEESAASAMRDQLREF